MNRLVIVARLKDGAQAEATALIRTGPPFDPEEVGLNSHAVYVTSSEVVFVFEASEVEWIVNDLIDDARIAAAFAPWRELIEGQPHLAHEQFSWWRAQDEVGVGLGL